MQIEFYITDSPRKRVTKNLSNKKALTGTLRAQSGVMSPVFTIENNGDIIGYNYCYIPTFKRYYYIKRVTAVRNNLFEIELDIDVLMTYANAIRQNSAIIDKVEQYGTAYPYINDGSFVNTNRTTNTILNYPYGFNADGEFILITAGGME